MKAHRYRCREDLAPPHPVRATTFNHVQIHVTLIHTPRHIDPATTNCHRRSITPLAKLVPLQPTGTFSHPHCILPLLETYPIIGACNIAHPGCPNQCLVGQNTSKVDRCQRRWYCRVSTA